MISNDEKTCGGGENKMKKLFWTIFCASVLFILSVVSIFAADTDQVTATVTPLVVGVTVSPTSHNYGVLALSTSDGSRTTATSAVITATNAGSVAEDFNIKGADSADWGINASPAATGTVGSGQFVHRYDAGSTFTTGEAAALESASGNYKVLADAVATSGTQDFVLQMNMPTATSVTAQQSTSVTVQAVQN